MAMCPSLLKYQSVITTQLRCCLLLLKFLVATWKWMSLVQKINKQLTFIFLVDVSLSPSSRASSISRINWVVVHSFTNSDWHLTCKGGALIASNARINRDNPCVWLICYDSMYSFHSNNILFYSSERGVHSNEMTRIDLNKKKNIPQFESL